MALNKTAFSKRAEQLKRYEDSDTSKESAIPKNSSNRKVRFSAGCVFLAACAAGDKEEVLNMLNSGGADIDTANVDGLTALHQACIEDNLDMVEFLVAHGADVNKKDNEGWTPLHATSSCGIVSIARYLVENGSDLASVNSDGELPIDIAASSAMADLLQKFINEYGIDCEEARQQEEKVMLSDAKKWLRSDASEADRPHPKTGATALHVAAAKGYTKVLGLLLAGRADVDRQDNDGWTPLHAACYWGKKEAAQMLISAMADMEIRNYSNQTSIDLAPKDMVSWLEELKKNTKRTKRRPISQIRISDTIENNIELPPKVIRVEVKSPENIADSEGESENSEELSEEEEEEVDEVDNDEEVEVAEDDQTQSNNLPSSRGNSLTTLVKESDSGEDSEKTKASKPENTQVQQIENPPKTQVPDKDNQTNEDVILRRTQSFENDEKFYQKYKELRERIKANSCPVLPASPLIKSASECENNKSDKESVVKTTANYIIQRSASLKDYRSQLLSKRVNEKLSSSTTLSSSPATPNSGHMRRSFAPPARDEESETQRKAHAKRVRETRRSTQGVTLDEIKSAEQLVKMKNANNNNGNTENVCDNSNRTIEETTTPSIPCEPTNTKPAVETSSEVAVNYTLTSPIRRSLRSETEKSDVDESKNSASFTFAPPLRSNNTINTLASRLEKSLDLEKSAVTATINVPLIPNKAYSVNSSLDISDKQKKTDLPNPKPAVLPRSIFDSVENASTNRLNKRLKQEAKKCEMTDEKFGAHSESSINEHIPPPSPSVVNHSIFGERRPSWRLRSDFSNKFKLEDASGTSSAKVISSVQPSSSASSSNGTSSVEASTGSKVLGTREVALKNDTGVSNTSETSEIEGDKIEDDKENEKDSDSRNNLLSQTMIQRRRRPKRRSTGLVHVDLDEIDPDNRQELPVDSKGNPDISGNESRSRADSAARTTADDGEFIDYKALYEAEKAENDKLRISLKSRDQDLAAAKLALERLSAAAQKSSLSENEKREKRAMERKVSEMEEELKLLHKYKQENERLRAENRALTRVVSKLTTSAQNQMLNKQ